MGSMGMQFDYRHHLLSAIEAFLAGTEETEQQGDRIVQGCPTPRPFTIDNVVWGSLLSQLKDSLIQQDSEYLSTLHQFLLGESCDVMQGVLSYDFRPVMESEVRECYEALRELIALLEGFPDAYMHGAMDDFVLKYTRGQRNAEFALRSLPSMDHWGDETLYILVLREVGAFVGRVEPAMSMQVGRLVLGFPGVQVFAPRHAYDTPDVSSVVWWARRALAALAGEDSLLLTWRIADGMLRFSVH